MQIHGIDEVVSAHGRHRPIRATWPPKPPGEAPSISRPRSPFGATSTFTSASREPFRFLESPTRHSRTANARNQESIETTSRVPIERKTRHSTLLNRRTPRGSSDNSAPPNDLHSAGRDRNRPVAPFERQARSSASDFRDRADQEADPSPHQSPNTPTEDEDLKRIRKLLAFDKPPFATGDRPRPTLPLSAESQPSRRRLADFDDDDDSDNTENRFIEAALRDEERLEAARRSRFGHATQKSFADPGYPRMSRRRTATGDDAVPSNHRPEPAFSQLANLNNDPLLKSIAADRKFGGLFTHKGSGAPTTPYVSSWLGPDDPDRIAPPLSRSKSSRLTSSTGKLFARKSPGPYDDWATQGGEFEIPAGGVRQGRHYSNSSSRRTVSPSGSVRSIESGVSGVSGSSRMNGLKRQDSNRLSNGSGLSKQQTGKTTTGLFQNTQKRGEGRSPANPKGLTLNGLTNGPTNGLTNGTNSLAARAEQRAATRPSRIPAPSPRTSRPPSSNSQHDAPRRSFSTVSSTSDRKPNRPPSAASSVSMTRSRTSTPTSPSKRQIPVPGRSLSVRKTSSNHEDRVASAAPQPGKLRRAETAPAAAEPEFPAAQSEQPTPGSPTAKALADEKAKIESFEAILRELEKEKSPEPSPLVNRSTRPRSNSVDSSFFRRSGNLLGSPPVTPAHTPKSAHGWDIPSARQQDHLLRSPTFSDFDDLAPMSGKLSAEEAGSPLYDKSMEAKSKAERAEKVAKVAQNTPKPKSPLEEEDSDMSDSLKQLAASDAEYEKLLTPQQNPEDDTFQLLGGSGQYEPNLRQRVRPREEAHAEDRANHAQNERHKKALNRLQTIQVELKSAREGIAYLERKLNSGASSDEEDEWFDEDSEMGKLLRQEVAEGKKKLDQLERLEQRLAVAERAHVKPQARIRPLARRPRWVQFVVVIGQLTAIWFLLELALYIHAFPPSTSSKPLEIAIVPTFGVQSYRAIAETLRQFLSSTLWTIPKEAFGYLVLFWRMIFGYLSAGITAAAEYGVEVRNMFARTRGPGAEVPLNEPPVVGSNYVV